MLLAAAGARVVTLGALCSGFRQDKTGVTALFDDGREAVGDLLIGADGIRSAVRAHLHGPAEPRRLNLTPAESAALVAFLKTLTDEALLKDVKYSDPFRADAAR